jgi:antitoxin HigA-1
MNATIELIKGIHPGFILERELKNRQLAKGKFALLLNEFPQTLVAIMKGKRRMNTPLALKIEQYLGIDEGFFMILQVFYDIEMQKKLQNKTTQPDLQKLRPILFWDTEIQNIDWQKYREKVVQRVFERGNEIEKAEIIRFYGKEIVDKIIKINEKAVL